MKMKHARALVVLSSAAVITLAALLVTAPRLIARTETKSVALAEVKTAPRPEPFLAGVGIHFGIGGEYGYEVAPTVQKIRELGLNSYRDDLAWDMFDWPNPAYYAKRRERMFDMLRSGQPARPVLIIGHPNPTVPGGNPPVTDEGRAAFADFAARAVRQTLDYNPIYEVWNEWNMNAVEGRKWLRGPGDASDPRAAVNYAALARATVDKLRMSAPKATVLVGAVGVDEGWKWTEGVLKEGVLKGADGLSVHLYNHCEGDRKSRNATEMIDRLGDLQAMVSSFNDGRPYPIYVTEFGWPSVSPLCGGPPADIPQSMAQFFLWSSATPWLKGSWVYQLKDQGRKRDEPEDNFGLYDYDYKPHDAACAVGAAARLALNGAPSAVLRPFHDVFLLVQDEGEKRRVIAWTSRADVKARLTLNGQALVTGKPLCGQEQRGEGGIEIGPMPMVMELPAASMIGISASAG